MIWFSILKENHLLNSIHFCKDQNRFTHNLFHALLTFSDTPLQIMRHLLFSFLAICGLCHHANAQFINMCEEISLSVSSQDTGYVQLYHPGFFIFGATENLGGFETLCEWSVSATDGAGIHTAVTTGEWADQSFTFFEHDVPLSDSMHVELILTNPNAPSPCCITDTLVWRENEIIPNVFIGSWTFIGNHLGADCVVSQTTQLEFDQILLYPQPASDVLRLTNAAGIESAMVFDTSGQLIAKFDVHQVESVWNINHLDDGYYILLLLDASGRRAASMPLIKSSASTHL